MSKRVVILLAGMPGSGKSIVAEIARKMGFFTFTLGDVVRQEAARRGLPLNDSQLGELARKLRKEHGSDAIAKIALNYIHKNDRHFLIDGIRSPAEIKVFKKAFDTAYVLAVHSSPRTRFRRLLKRGRKDDPKTWEEFEARDRRELSFGLGEVIALADYMLVNEDSLEKFKKDAEEMLRRMLEDA
ncbi:MAG: flagellar hook-basal body complex protein FliE [Thermoproteales archaeon]|nr:flagellar hook-basal body complex protein FliE [Thermoproteales archaeon]